MIRRLIVCNECLTEGHSLDGVIQGPDTQVVRAMARDLGWKITTRRDLCPECAETS